MSTPATAGGPGEARAVRASGAGDWAPLSTAVEDTRRRASEYPHDAPGADARAALRAAADVELWEARRKGRYARLWVASVEARTAAWDERDARYRLCRYIRRPCHRIGDTPVLYSTAGPRPCAGTRPGPRASYPREAVAHRHDRTPFGALERAHVTGYVRALSAARRRVLSPSGAPTGADDVGDADGGGPAWPAASAGRGLTWWRVRHRVLFLAGPGEAPTRAAELAATIVDDDGHPAAEVVGLRADDGCPGGDGRWVHPAHAMNSGALVALWDDFDATEADGPGDPAALARVLTVAAARLWKEFTTDARRHSGEWNARS